MNRRNILFIYEGEKTERHLFSNLHKIFFEKSADLHIVGLAAGENIYMLWKRLKEDDYETDVVEVLREYSENAKEALEGYSRRCLEPFVMKPIWESYISTIQ